MLYIIWAILNIAFSICFLYLCYRAIRLIKTNHGIHATIVFVWGLLLLKCDTSNDDTHKPPAEKDVWTSYQFPTKEISRQNISAAICSNPLFTVHINIFYALSETGSPLPINATAYTTGLTAGIQWKLLRIQLDTAGQKIKYHVTGVTDWTLLGSPIRAIVEPVEGFVTVSKSSSTLFH